MKMKWLLLAGSIPLFGACPSTTVGEGEGDVAGEGEGDAGEGEGEGDAAEGEGDAAEGEGDAGEGEGEGEGDAGEGEGEGASCPLGQHDGGDGTCVPNGQCVEDFHLDGDACSLWTELASPPSQTVSSPVSIVKIRQTIHVVPFIAAPPLLSGVIDESGAQWTTPETSALTLFRPVSVDENALIVGGRDEFGSYTADVRASALSDNGGLDFSGTLVAALAIPRGAAGAGFIDGAVVVVGGFDGTQFLSSIERAPVDAAGLPEEFQLVGSTPSPLLGPVVYSDGDRVWLMAGSSFFFYRQTNPGSFDSWDEIAIPEVFISCAGEGGTFICTGRDSHRIWSVSVTGGEVAFQPGAAWPADAQGELVPVQVGTDAFVIGGPLETDDGDVPDRIWRANLSALLRHGGGQ